MNINLQQTITNLDGSNYLVGGNPVLLGNLISNAIQTSPATDMTEGSDMWAIAQSMKTATAAGTTYFSLTPAEQTGCYAALNTAAAAGNLTVAEAGQAAAALGADSDVSE